MTQRKTYSRSANTRSRSTAKSSQRKHTSVKKPQNRGGGNIGWLILALIVVAGGIFAFSYIKNIFSDNILEGVMVDGINISGMIKNEAYDIVQKAVQEKLDKISVTFRYEEKSWHFNAEDLQAVINIDDVIDKAYDAGRDGSLIERYKSQQDIKSLGLILKSVISVNEQILIQALSDVKNEIDNPMIEASITFDPSNYDYFEDIRNPEVDMSRDMFTITPGKVGYVMDYDKATRELNAALADGWTADIEITAGEAYPKYTVEELQKSTALIFHSSSKISTKNRNIINRNSNIEKAIGFFKGLVVQPGEVISYNDLLGQRLRKDGWLEAPTITQDKILVDALGGGICQASTTIFNAAYMAGTTIIDRGPHSWPAYYQDFGYGMDAMVNWGTDDLIFRNDSDYPLFFNTYFWIDPNSGLPGWIDVDVYGMPQPDGMHIKPEWTIESREDPGEPQYIEDIENKYIDEDWKIDTELNKMVYEFRKPRETIKVLVYRVWYKDCVETSPGVWEGGAEVKREEPHFDTYTGVTGIYYTKPIPVVTPIPEPTPEGGASG